MESIQSIITRLSSLRKDLDKGTISEKLGGAIETMEKALSLHLDNKKRLIEVLGRLICLDELTKKLSFTIKDKEDDTNSKLAMMDKVDFPDTKDLKYSEKLKNYFDYEHRMMDLNIELAKLFKVKLQCLDNTMSLVVSKITAEVNQSLGKAALNDFLDLEEKRIVADFKKRVAKVVKGGLSFIPIIGYGTSLETILDGLLKSGEKSAINDVSEIMIYSDKMKVLLPQLEKNAEISTQNLDHIRKLVTSKIEHTEELLKGL